MTVRQNSKPVNYDMTRRMDNASILTSGKAGVVIPVTFIPLLRGDSASGRISFDLELAEMPKPIENAVIARFQVWNVPRPALPAFSGLDEYTHAWHGEDITALGSSPRTPPELYTVTDPADVSVLENSEFFRSLGLSLESNRAINVDYIDAYNLVHNFRLAAHSSKMTRNDYYIEGPTAALELKPAFWPRNRMHNIVPDYEQALVTGALDLDFIAGSIPISGLGVLPGSGGWVGAKTVNESDGTSENYAGAHSTQSTNVFIRENPDNALFPAIYAEMAGETVLTSLADIDKARTTNAFAKAMAAYAGTNYSGFNNDDVIVSEMMQGFAVPEALFNRPWLVDSKTSVFGMTERHATDAANLADSVSVGRAQATLSVNLPKQDHGSICFATVEVMPERLYERQRDEYLYVQTPDDMPNQLRDVQRVEPVDTVDNGRVDVKHTAPLGVFGYEPMNAKWKRERTTLGGEFRQLTPGTPNTTARTAIWQADYVDPVFTSDHWLCPFPFPQDVFSVPANDIVNIGVTQQIVITGLTQYGDDLVEDNNEHKTVSEE